MRKILILVMGICSPAWGDKFDGALDVFESSPALKPYFENAYSYVIFPTVGKGGFVFGGSHGKGRVYRGDQVVGKASLTEVSIGLQLGGQVFSEVIFLQDRRAFDEFAGGGFEFDGSASAVIIVVGAQAQTGTAGTSISAGAGLASTRQAEYGYNKGMAVFVHPLGGLMYEASIGGQKFSYEPIEEESAEGEN